MSKKASKKIKKITHVRLKKQDGDTFDFTKPYELLEENKLSVPTVDTEIGGTYIEVPDFLHFKSTKKTQEEKDSSPKQQTLINASTENIESKESVVTDSTDTVKKGAFQQYFEEKSFSGIYRTKATFKSLIFAILGALSFCSVLFFASVGMPWAFIGLIISGALTVLFTSLFFVVSVDRFAVYIYALFFCIAILFSGALAGMVNFITVLLALAVFLILLFAFQETERLQVINRIFDFYYITKPATKILNLLLVAVITLSVTNAYSNQNTRNAYQKWIPQSQFETSLSEKSTVFSPISSLVTGLLEIQSYNSFVEAKKSTAFDYVLIHDYANSINNAASDVAKKDASDPLITAEQKTEILTSSAYQHITSDLISRYKTTIGPDQKLTQSDYNSLTYSKTLTSLSDMKTSLYKTGTGFFAIQQNFSAFILGLLVAITYTLFWIAYRVVNSVLNVAGLSVEKISWRIVKALKIVKVETESLESEIVVV